MWLDENEMQFRFGFGGLRLSMPNNATAPKGVLDTIGTVYGSAPNYKPVWMPFHNIIPMFKPTFETGTIVNTGATGKYLYKIDPFNDRGICYVDWPAIDGSGNYQESWILLPPVELTYNGNNIGLPVGYTITIINGTSMIEKRNVFVSGNVSTLHGCKIIDANQNANYYCSLNGEQSRDTYIYVGSYYDSSIGTNCDYWIAMHDTQ